MECIKQNKTDQRDTPKKCACKEPNIGMSHKYKSQAIKIKYCGRKLL